MEERKGSFQKRVLMCVLGVVVAGISVGFFRQAAFGVDPFQSLMSGLNTVIPIQFGTLYLIANCALLLFSLIADRHYIGLATIINLTLLGYVAQFTDELIGKIFPDLTIMGRMILLIIGIFIICFASAFYFTADLGVSTYDAVALIISKTWKIGKFFYIRIICDFVCVALGSVCFFISGGSLTGLFAIVGFGTIITAFFMGPLIEFFNVKVAEPFLYGKNN